MLIAYKARVGKSIILVISLNDGRRNFSELAKNLNELGFGSALIESLHEHVVGSELF